MGSDFSLNMFDHIYIYFFYLPKSKPDPGRECTSRPRRRGHTSLSPVERSSSLAIAKRSPPTARSSVYCANAIQSAQTCRALTMKTASIHFNVNPKPNAEWKASFQLSVVRVSSEQLVQQRNTKVCSSYI